MGVFSSVVEGVEKKLISMALQHCKGNQSAAARELGIKRSTLLDRAKRHGLLSVQQPKQKRKVKKK